MRNEKKFDNISCIVNCPAATVRWSIFDYVVMTEVSLNIIGSNKHFTHQPFSVCTKQLHLSHADDPKICC